MTDPYLIPWWVYVPGCVFAVLAIFGVLYLWDLLVRKLRQARDNWEKSKELMERETL